jgi:hypothetical protein
VWLRSLPSNLIDENFGGAWARPSVSAVTNSFGLFEGAQVGKFGGLEQLSVFDCRE